jgi:hypothetical protein
VDAPGARVRGIGRLMYDRQDRRHDTDG